jgi:adenine-specific DNA-methyltransferase
MTIHTDSTRRFQSLLRETFFQFDAAELDFGIYRIINHRREEIDNFIEKDLIQAVAKEFEIFKAQSLQELRVKVDEKKKEIEKLEKDLDEKILTNGQIEEKFKDKRFAKDYLELNKQLCEVELTESEQAEVFNNLYTFFSRYYEDGDFISKRRYSSRNTRYAIPYNGEEVKFYWANSDQYYVKTGEVFKDYQFDCAGWRIVFRTAFADVESANIKGERKYFLLAPSDAVNVDKESKACRIQFEYRQLTDEDLLQYKVTTKTGEEKKAAIQQDELNLTLANMVLGKIKEAELKAILAEKPTEKTVLEKHLFKYSRKITSDFFVHKNLRGFLERELDYFIKTEILDIHNPDPRHLTRAKVVENIGKRVIEFLAGIEDYERLLWEKKKFVLRTDYVITSDRVPEELLEEVLRCKTQLQEWADLGFGKINIKKDLNGKKLPVDTKHFDNGFKERLLERLSEEGNIDDLIDGVLIKSENWQALNLLLAKYREKVKCIYIDPPYNTNASPILYKNNYKHSSWLSLMHDRISLGKNLLCNTALQCTTVDDMEFHRLREDIIAIFGDENIAGVVAIKSNPSGRSTVKGFSIAHEYAIFSSPTSTATIGMIPRTKHQIAQYKEKDMYGYFQWRNFMRSGGANDFRTARPKLHYPLVIHNGKIAIPKMQWNNKTMSWELLETPSLDDEIVLPVSNGIEYTWRLGVESLAKRLDEVRLRTMRGGKKIVEVKFRIDEEGVLPKTVWDDKQVNATAYGTTVLRNLMGVSQAFPFPKSVYAVQRCIQVCGTEENDWVLDYYAGSGTTGHAVINLNRQDGGNRKYILVEIGDWFEKVLVPRIKKVAFCEKWKGGKPQDSQGLSQVIKYHYIEQYEDTLHNIEFPNKEKGQTALKLFPEEAGEYVMRYMLQHQTEGSASLLNVKQFENPFEYKLRIISDVEREKTVPVDLVETFNYLLGMSVSRYRFLNENGRKYIIVLGERRNRRVAVIWRPTKDIDLKKDKELIEKAFAGFYPDEIFINGDASIKDYKVIESEFKALMGL